VGQTRIQLCGPLVARLSGERVESRLPGRQGRTLFAFLVLERRRVATRDEVTAALWDGEPPAAADAALNALLSKLRRVLQIEGRHEVRLTLPEDAWVDVEVATEALHRAEGAAAREDWQATWGPARVAQHVATRTFLPEDAGGWASRRRDELLRILVSSLELAAAASLGIGGSELATAERSARRLVELAPLRETGTRLLMEATIRRGNPADALVVYDRLRVALRDALGVAPSAETQALHRRLLG